MRKEIDGNKFDIRIICTSRIDSADAGYVDGVPIDPPDDSPGWSLVDLWVEHDTEQETVVERHEDENGKKVERKKLVTRLVNPAHYQLWVKPKPPVKKARAKKAATAPAPVVLKADGDVKVPKAEPKKKRGRSKKTQPAATPPNGEGGDAPGFDSVRAEHEFVKFCEHTRQMLVDTVNFGEKRDITLEDLNAYTRLCHECERAAKELDTATGGA